MQAATLFSSFQAWSPFPLIALACTAFAGLWCAKNSLRGTTLLHPWTWSIVSIAAVLTSDVINESISATAFWLAPMRYVAYISTFCPLMALLGAKKPQSREWNYIVFAMWVVLATPAASALLFPQPEFVIDGIWSWLLLLLFCLNLANYLPTRFWLAGILFAAAQFTLVHEHLAIFNSAPFIHALTDNMDASGRVLFALLLILLAISAAGLAHSRFNRRVPVSRLEGFDRAWLDFRNSYGAIWALRIAERLNAASRTANWDFVCRWRGLQFGRDRGSMNHDDATADAIEQALRNLLRRFVSNDWIDARLTSVDRSLEQIDR
jgi:hypothetical protein